MESHEDCITTQKPTSSLLRVVCASPLKMRISGWKVHGLTLKGGTGRAGSPTKFANSDSEEESSTSVKFANESSDYSGGESTNVEDDIKATCSSELIERFKKDTKPVIFAKSKTCNTSTSYEFREKLPCSKSCPNKCSKSVLSMSTEEILEMKSNFTGKSNFVRKNRLLKYLQYQQKFSDYSIGLVYKQKFFCKSFLAHLLDFSNWTVKTVFKDWQAGLVEYVHGGVANIRESLATVQCISWMKVFASIHGQDSPDEIITVLPSYLTRAELYRTYREETSGGRQVKRSSFYKILKSKFGPRRLNKSIQQIRISKYSSHSVCDVCLGLDNFQRTCKSQEEIRYCQALKQNHKFRYGNSRVEIGRLKQLSINFPLEWMTFQIDGMDNSKSYIPKYLVKGKKLAGLYRLPCKITGGIIWSSLYPQNRKNKFFINHDHFPNSSNMVVSIVFLMLKDVVNDHKILPKCLHINLDNCGLEFMHALI